MGYLILADKNFNYITSISSNKIHFCLEQKLQKGEYYLFCDINYRYVNKKQNIYGYNIRFYSNNLIKFKNITEKKNVSECLKKTMISYCKQNIIPKQINNVKVYFSKSFEDNLPFVVGYFENNSLIDSKVIIELKNKGDKSCGFYYDTIANEDDEYIIKNLQGKKNSSCIVLVMKYTILSLFTINYLITSNFEKIEKRKKNLSISQLKSMINNDNNDVIDDNIVFKEEGQAHDIEPLLIQYYLEINNGYIIGIENKTNKKQKIKLLLEGLEITDSYYKGRESLFYIDPKEKKTFNTNIKNRYKGDLSFKFELLEE